MKISHASEFIGFTFLTMQVFVSPPGISITLSMFRKHPTFSRAASSQAKYFYMNDR